jgi:hypothetical protein
MLLRLFRNRQSAVDKRQGAIVTPRRGLKLGKQPVIEWSTEPKTLVHEGRKLLPEVNRAPLWVDQLPARPMRVNPIEFSNALDPVLLGQREHGFRGIPRGQDVVSLALKNGPPIESYDSDWENAQLLSAPDCPVD